MQKIFFMILLLCCACPIILGKTHIFWISNLEHHYDKIGRTQEEWRDNYNIVSFVNGSFFYSNNTIIPPFATTSLKSIRKNYRRWWYIQCNYTMRYNYSALLHDYTYELYPPNVKPNELSTFIISVCPPLIFNEKDISKKMIYSLGGRAFSKRYCRRTMIGKTKTNSMFIAVGTGNLFSMRKKLRAKIDNISWLANLDGGSSTFATVFGNHTIENKRKIPSIISYDVKAWDTF